MFGVRWFTFMFFFVAGTSRFPLAKLERLNAATRGTPLGWLAALLAHVAIAWYNLFRLDLRTSMGFISASPSQYLERVPAFMELFTIGLASPLLFLATLPTAPLGLLTEWGSHTLLPYLVHPFVLKASSLPGPPSTSLAPLSFPSRPAQGLAQTDHGEAISRSRVSLRSTAALPAAGRPRDCPAIGHDGGPAAHFPADVPLVAAAG